MHCDGANTRKPEQISEHGRTSKGINLVPANSIKGKHLSKQMDTFQVDSGHSVYKRNDTLSKIRRKVAFVYDDMPLDDNFQTAGNLLISSLMNK